MANKQPEYLLQSYEIQRGRSIGTTCLTLCP